MSNSPLHILEGPSSIPANPTHALICLHGFGADGNDLLPVAQAIKSALGQVTASMTEGSEAGSNSTFNAENMALFSLHAPSPTPFNQGRQWFRDMGWSFRDPEGLARATNLLETTLTSITQQTGIPRSRMALLGFSQGSMTLLHALPLLSKAPAAVISLCGGLTVEPLLKPGTPTTTPLLFIHGLADDVWPADVTVHAEAFYQKNGYPTQLELIEGLGHGIDNTVMAHATVFLAHTLATT